MPAQKISSISSISSISTAGINDKNQSQTLAGKWRPSTIPSYAELPAVPDMPHGCTWGLWDRQDHPDQLGTLNLLTPSTILAARDEIQYGINVAINWSLDNCETPHSNRRKPNHKIMQLPDWVGHDDEIQMNTQSGSQWDGFRKSAFEGSRATLTWA